MTSSPARRHVLVTTATSHRHCAGSRWTTLLPRDRSAALKWWTTLSLLLATLQRQRVPTHLMTRIYPLESVAAHQPQLPHHRSRRLSVLKVRVHPRTMRLSNQHLSCIIKGSSMSPARLQLSKQKIQKGEIVPMHRKHRRRQTAAVQKRSPPRSPQARSPSTLKGPRKLPFCHRNRRRHQFQFHETHAHHQISMQFEITTAPWT